MRTTNKQFIESFMQRIKRAFTEVFDNPVGRPAKKAIITVVGVFVTLLGVVLFVLPGPGVLFVILGLGILALEYPKARTWLKKFQNILSASAKKADDFFARRKA
ncbi:MAG: PGPGW domain-containing protein [Kangiellaceae bacterium]|nr:PGPGW domain-containing protein [Kangiellaceae bacterium]